MVHIKLTLSGQGEGKKMIEKIKEWFKVYSRKKEAQTQRDGFLSYAGEFHSLALGLGVGFMSAVQQNPEMMSAFIAITLSLGTGGETYRRVKKKLGKIGKEIEKSTAIGEIRREPWYALGGSMITYAVFTAGLHGFNAVEPAVREIIKLPF